MLKRIIPICILLLLAQNSIAAIESQDDMPKQEESQEQENSENLNVDQEGADREEKRVGALEQDPGFELEAHLAGLYMLSDEPLEPTNEFRVSRARLKLSWQQWKLIEAVLKVEAAQIFYGRGVSSLLRDLYVRVQPLSWIGLRVGQFKKPFSRLELTSWSKFRLIERGISNDYLIEHLLYGERDIGATLEGRLIKSIKLDYAIGVFNGMGKNTREIGLKGTKDVVARLEMEPTKGFELGVNGSLKFIEEEDLPGFVYQNNFSKVTEDAYPLGYSAIDFKDEYHWMTGMSWMTGIDACLKLKKLRIIAEGLLGENWWFEKYPYTWSATLLASYKFKLGKKVPIWLEPAVKGEVLTFLTEGMDEWRARLWQVTPGLNLHIGRHVRFMINGDFIFAEGSEADIDGSRRDGLWPNEFPGNFQDSKRLLLQLAFEV
jgi:hypothetical protein